MVDDLQNQINEIDRKFKIERKKLKIKFVFIFSPIFSILWAVGFYFLWNATSSESSSIDFLTAIFSGLGLFALLAVFAPIVINFDYKLPSRLTIEKIDKKLAVYQNGKINDASKNVTKMVLLYQEIRALKSDVSRAT